MATNGTFSANGDSNTVYVFGPFGFTAEGTWGSGTITLKYTVGGTQFTLNQDTAMTSDATGETLVDWPVHLKGIQKIPVVATLASATSPDLDWAFFGNVSDNANT